MNLLKLFKLSLIAVLIVMVSACTKRQKFNLEVYPAINDVNVQPDTRLVIVFPEGTTPTRGESGLICVYDAVTDTLVDKIDISIPDGPTTKPRAIQVDHNPATPYNYARSFIATNRNTKPDTPSSPESQRSKDKRMKDDSTLYQISIIGGFTDGFHFHPVMIKENRVIIQPHHNMITYKNRYYVTIDKSVLDNAGDSWNGVSKEDKWIFSTAGNAMGVSRGVYQVRQDGKGDFTTIQGAFENLPDSCKDTIIINVSEGDYEELIYFRNKTHVRLVGAGAGKTVLHYRNSDCFNLSPIRNKTADIAGSFPNRNAVMHIDNCYDIVIENMSIVNDEPDVNTHSPAIWINGEHIMLQSCELQGGRSMLMARGKVYVKNCKLFGNYDMVSTLGALYLEDCLLLNNNGPYCWVHNEEGKRGLVLKECTFQSVGTGISDLGRTNGLNMPQYPGAEMVLLNCVLKNIQPGGWTVICSPTCFFAEYNSKMSNGSVIDHSCRHPYAKWLELPKDDAVIQNYSSPKWFFGGWDPDDVFREKYKRM
jgi:hypothetical protein